MTTNLAFLLGPTNVGKTTLIENAIKEMGAHGVFVGKDLRAKYGEDYFKGQAAPDHTKEESLKIMDEGIKEGIKQKKTMILVDGQPRSDDQLKYIVKNYLSSCPLDFYISFLLLHCSDDTRRKRMESRDLTPEKRKLAEQRFYGDLPQVYKLVYDLIIIGCKDIIYPINSEHSLRQLKIWHKNRISENELIEKLRIDK